jgi:membrane-associated phospholipid phosphatase
MPERMLKFLPRYAIIFYTIMFSLQNAGHAQGLKYPPKPKSPKSSAPNIGGDVLSFAATVGGDVLHVLTSPLRLTQNDGLQLLVFTATTTTFVTFLDKRIDGDFIERDDFHVKPAIALAKIGDGYDEFISRNYLRIGLPVTMLAGGLVFKDKKLLLTTRLMVESFFITGKITMIGKGVFGRARPYAGEGPLDFSWFKFNARQERRSLPSGHVSSAFSIMTVLAKQYDSWWIKIPAYTVGVATAFQRMESRNHWGADVILGGAIGYGVGSALVNRYKQPSKSSTVNPYIMGNRVGLIIKI